MVIVFEQRRRLQKTFALLSPPKAIRNDVKPKIYKDRKCSSLSFVFVEGLQRQREITLIILDFNSTILQLVGFR